MFDGLFNFFERGSVNVFVYTNLSTKTIGA